jgi:type II secretory pathway pseudopilin PulG
MGGNRQRLGFRLVELIFILVLIGAFLVCVAFRAFRFQDDIVYETKIALSETVFLTRLHSIASGALGVYKAPVIRMSECKFVNSPSNRRSSNYLKNSFQTGEIPQQKVIFEERFFPSLQLRFWLDGQECYITVDTKAQT